MSTITDLTEKCTLLPEEKQKQVLDYAMKIEKGRNSPLELSPTYLSYNNLIWQIPAWGVAISTGVVVAACKIGETKGNFAIPIKQAQSFVLSFGLLLLVALNLLLYRFRSYQSAAAPEHRPSPPFQTKGNKSYGSCFSPPSANSVLQLCLCLTTGGVLGLTLVQLNDITFELAPITIVFATLFAGIISWLFCECFHERNVERIERLRKTPSDGNYSYHPQQVSTLFKNVLIGATILFIIGCLIGKDTNWFWRTTISMVVLGGSAIYLNYRSRKINGPTDQP